MIRPARATDLGALLEIEQAAQISPWSETALSQSLHAGLGVWVSEDAAGQVQGWAGLRVVADEAEILNIAVHPAAQRQGMARALMQAVLEAAVQSGVEKVFLEVRAGGEAAQALYLSLGFVACGRRKGYYATAAGGREDALLMRWDCPRR